MLSIPKLLCIIADFILKIQERIETTNVLKFFRKALIEILKIILFSKEFSK